MIIKNLFNNCNNDCYEVHHIPVPGPAGPAGPQGSKGDKGDTGANGTGLEISGTVNEISDLPITASNGMAYFVGVSTPRKLYIYDAVNKIWVDQGTIQGEKGEQGVSITDLEIAPTSTTEEGILYGVTVTLSDGSSINAGDFLASKGKDGSDGKSATINVGTVTTGESGSEASVTNSGTETEAVFDFVIPKGDTFGVTSMLSLNFQDVSESLTPLPISDALPIPTNNPPVNFDFDGNITVTETGYYELTFSGMIVGGANTDNGGSIILQNSTKGTPLDNMKFNLDASKDHQLQFSATEIYRLEENTVLRVMTVGAGSDTDVTSFNSVCLIIKKLKLE